MQKQEFSPMIVCMACNWCTYTGSDQAGKSRMQRPANVRIIRLMCSARADPEYAIRLLNMGVDGVIIGACHLGDCHYLEGNYKTVRRYGLLKEMIAQFGFNPERLQMWHISASEGAEFTARIREYVEVLKKLGPNPKKSNHMIDLGGM